MRASVLFLTLILAVFSSAVIAGHDYPRHGHSTQHQWAHHYATTAIRQFNRARLIGCRFHGRRWSASYDEHYQWAYRNDRYHARQEMARRDEDILSCSQRRGHGRNHHRGWDGRNTGATYGYPRGPGEEAFARWYADTAVAQSDENYQYQCGGRDDRWTRNWNAHYHWALGVRRHQALHEVDQRAHQLRQCGSYGYRY